MELIGLGFIFQEKMWADEDLKGKSYINIPVFDDDDDDDHNMRQKSAVHHNVFSFLPEDVVVLSSCNGLICCRSCGFMTKPEEKTTFYICNPANKQWIPLDCPTDFDRFGSFALAFDPCKDLRDISTKFNLVRVKQDVHVNDEGELQYFTNFEIYSSETKSWKISKASCPYSYEVTEDVPGIYIRGVLYWRPDVGAILSFDVEKESSLVISPPTPSPSPGGGFRLTCIGEWEGNLHYVMISKQGLRVWLHKDDAQWEEKVWRSLEEIGSGNSKFKGNLKKVVLESVDSGGDMWMISLLLLGLKDGVLLMNLQDDIYFYNIEKNMAVEACNHKDLSPQHLPCLVLPHFMSIVSLR